MLAENNFSDKNIKDSNTDLSITVKDSSTSISYTKFNKLIIALYMVTDIMDKDEPLRNKLRTLGTDIISDINSVPSQAIGKIIEIVSFLDIARAINLISEMNCSILKKEFLELQLSVIAYGEQRSRWLPEFLLTSRGSDGEVDKKISTSKNSKQKSIGHDRSSRTTYARSGIGVQKGSTLMKALSDRASILFDTNFSLNSFNILKKKRREDILEILRKNENGLTITDIKNIAKQVPSSAESLISCSEKTLQRELVSMVKDGVLNKTGAKRWSRYFIK